MCALVLSLVAACQIDSLFDPGEDEENPNPPPSQKPATRVVLSNASFVAIAGVAISPAVRAVAQDEDGNVVNTYAGQVSVSLLPNNNNGVLSGTTTRAAVNGVATYPDLSVSPPGSYRLIASAPGLQSGPSLSFDVNPGAPPTLTIVSGNSQTDSIDAALPAQYVVRVATASGSPVPGVSIEWDIASGGGSVSPDRSTTDANGVARATHKLGPSMGAHTVRAAATGVAGSPKVFTASATHGAPAQVSYMDQPRDAQMGTPLSPPVRIQIDDRRGNRATGFSGTVAVGITPGTGAPLAVLTGTRTRSVTEGVATFNDLRINLPGNNYRLRASAIAQTLDSETFDIRLVGGSQIVMLSGNAQSDSVSAVLNDYTVRVLTPSDEPVPGVTVDWEVTAGNGSVSPGQSVTDAGGYASATHTLGTSVGAHTVSASASGLVGSPRLFTSFATAGVATAIGFTVQPATANVGAPIGVKVGAFDRFGNSASDHSGTATIALVPGTGAAGASLSGTLTVPFANGEATFGNLSIDSPASGYRLRASAIGRTSDSQPFDVQVAAGSSIAVHSGNAQTDTITAVLNPYTVRVTTPSNQAVAGVTISWAVTAGNGSVSVAQSVTNANGEASTTHTLGSSVGSHAVSASANGLVGSPLVFTSTATHGAATDIQFSSQPSDTPADAPITPAVTVAAFDRHGNPATSHSGTVSMSITPGTGTPLAVLAGTLTVPFAQGVATFGDLRIDLPGAGYKLRASALSRVVDSGAFTVQVLFR